MQPKKLFQALVAAGACSVFGTPAFADEQSDRIRALEARLEASTQQLDRMLVRIAELERTAKPAPAAPAAAVPAAQAETVAALQQSVSQLSESMSRRSTDVGVPLHGFADVGAASSSGKDPTPLRGFNGGTLDLYLTPQFGQRVKGLVELAVEYGQDGVAAIDMERLQLGYTLSDDTTLWLGRFHTPMGLWNTSYHHGANLQTSIFRPRFIDFEDKGGIIPAHSVGLWASGKTAVSGGRLTYDVMLTNAHRIVDQTLDFGAFTDDARGKMLGGNLGYQPSGSLSGLTLGVHAFGSTVHAYGAGDALLNATKVLMTGAYAGYDENDWEVIGEYYRFNNSDDASGERHVSNLGFVQVGRTFGAYTPFVRFEQAGLNASDNYFRSQESGRSYKRTSLGVRYALDPKSSLKLELGSTTERATDLLDSTGTLVPFAATSYRRAAIQYSVAF